MANFTATLIDSVASGLPGPYTGPALPYYSEAAKGVGYYRKTNGLHTASYTTASDFIGTLKLQGSLATSPTDTDWVDIIGSTIGDNISVVPNGTAMFNFEGNFVWIRAVIVEFSDGAINQVLFTHN